jgi:hypothetical protein
VADLGVPSAPAMQASIFRLVFFRLELCQPITPALPVGERRLRHVAVSWTALRQATARHCTRMYRHREQSTRAQHEFNSRLRRLRVESVGQLGLFAKRRP